MATVLLRVAGLDAFVAMPSLSHHDDLACSTAI
jgi:hypothetical protein